METISIDQLVSITGGITLQRQLFHLDRLLSTTAQQQTNNTSNLTTMFLVAMAARRR